MKSTEGLGWLNEISSVPLQQAIRHQQVAFNIDPTTVTVSRDPCGRWYVSLAVDAADPVQLPSAGAITGVDLGVKDFAVTSGGDKIPNPRRLARRERNLARYQRRLARCQKGSANRAKARVQSAVKQEPRTARAGTPVFHDGE